MSEFEIGSVQELSINEKLNTEGGWLIPLLIGAVIGAALTDWSGFKNGIADGYNGR